MSVESASLETLGSVLEGWTAEEAFAAVRGVGVDTTQGLPALEIDFARISGHEFLPSAFYLPVITHWILLGLLRRNWHSALSINPSIPFSGLVGENKWQVGGVLHAGCQEHVPLTVLLTVPEEITELPAQLAELGLNFPMIAKPLLGCRGQGIAVLKDAPALYHHLSAYHVQGESILLQQMVPWPGEVGVGFLTRPDGSTEVISLTFKVQPVLEGDGVTSLGMLIEQHPRFGKLAHLYRGRHATAWDEIIPAGTVMRLAFVGSHSGGSYFVDGLAHITAAVHARVAAIVNKLDGVRAGRFDIRFRNWQDFIDHGQDFALIELNGIGGEMTHVWDPRHNVFTAWRAWFAFNEAIFRIARALPMPTPRKGFFVLARAILRARAAEKTWLKRYPFPLP